MDTFLKIVGIILCIVVAVILLPIAIGALVIVVKFLIKLFAGITLCGFLGIVLACLVIYLIWG